MVLGTVSLVVLIVMTMTISGSSNFWYRGGQFVGTILTVLVVYAVSGRKTLLSRFLSNPVLKWIGDRSNSIYLWHYPIILLISKGIKASWWITLIEIVLSVVLAELSYRFIETPIRHGIIGEYLNILRSRPKSRQEKKRQVQVARRSLKVIAGTFVLTVSLILCMVFVPKKNALDTLQKREAKAKETGKMTEEQLAKQKANGSESEDTICTTDLTDDEILEGLNLLLIGDSIAVDVTDDFYEMFPNSVSDTKIGRITSLGKQVLDSYIDEKKWEGEGVIFASLSNSPINGELEDIREKIGKDMPLFLTTVRIPHDTFEEESNSKIKKFVEENETKVEVPEGIDLNIIKSTVWNEYSERCIACGRCNFVCPTCTCFTMQDVFYKDNENAGERRRVWASCQVDGYTDMAGGHSFRKDKGQRMRFKVMHKVYDYKKRWGYHMCVGCGRCDDICPEYISFSECVNKLKDAVEEVKDNA